MKVRLPAAVGLTVVAIASLGVAASPAYAADCGGRVGITLKDGNLIKGSGFIAGCPSTTRHTIYMRIEKKTILGAWKTLVSKSITGPNGASGGMAYNCSGEGTQTYQTVVDWRTVGGDYRKAVSNNIRVSC